MAKSLGVTDRLLNGNAKAAWKFIGEYQEKYGTIPSVGLIVENSGCVVKPPDSEEDRVELRYVVDQLYDRFQFKSLNYGLGKSSEALENGNQQEAVDEVLKLSDHLRSERRDQLQIHSLGDVAPDVLAMYERVKRGETGVPFPWQTMTDMTLGMWPGTLTFFVARPGVGKCVHEDTEIIDPVTGVPTSIRQVYDSRGFARVASWSKERGVHAVPISAKVDTGRKECLRVTFRTGRTITVTPEHPFLSPEGWLRADAIKVGMTMALPARMPTPEQPVSLSPLEVDLLAVLLSEGSYTGHHTGFTTSDASILEIARAAGEWAGAPVKHRSRYDYDFVRPAQSAEPNAVREILRRHGIAGTLAKHKVLPEAIWRLPLEQLSRFLSVFWMCDGYVDAAPGVTLASERLVRQIQSLLLRLGVQSSVGERTAKIGEASYPAWRLRVHAECFEAFAAGTSLWGDKKDRLDALLTMERNPNIGFPRVSDETIEALRRVSDSGTGRWQGGKHEMVAAALDRVQFQFRDMFGASNSIKKTAFVGFAEVYGIADQYAWWWNSDIFWNEVVTIDSVGEQKIYDLTIADTHCFVANDVIVHNTWTAVIMAMHVWQVAKLKVLIVSPELGRVELGERCVAKYGGFSYKDMVSAELGVFAEPKFYQVIEELKANGEGLYILDDEDRLQPDYIEQAVEAVQPDIVIIDSLYMLRVERGKVKSGAGSKGDRMERVVETINWMRGLSRKKRSFAPEGLPVVGIHQLSRDGKVRSDAAKSIKSGRGTGGLEDTVALSDALFWNAHNLFAMYQDQYMMQDHQLMYVPLKARRQTKVSSLVISWDLVTMDFKELGTKVGEQTAAYQDEELEVPY